MVAALFFCAFVGCGEEDSAENPQTQDVCNCAAAEPINRQYRGAAKHVAIPSGQPEEITVRTILNWEAGSDPAPRAARTGRELQLFRIARAFLQLAWVNPEDCDLHLEISETSDRAAPRVIVETPIDSGYCPSRSTLKQQLAALGEQLNTKSGELKQPRPIEVLGLAFQDADHPRGSTRVATVWELHPAVVSVLPR